MEKLDEKKWVQKAEKKGIKHGVFPENFFASKKSAEGYASGLVKYSNGDVGKAIKRLNFYINRGKDVPNKGALKAALKILEKRLEREKSKKEAVQYKSADKFLAEKFQSLNETGEMSRFDIEEGGEDYEWAMAIQKAAEEIESMTEGKLKFEEMRPFDKYQGPYALVRVNGRGCRLWSGNDEMGETLFLAEPFRYMGTVGDISEAINGDVEAIKRVKENIEEKKLTPAEIEEFQDDDDDKDVEKIERPKGSLRKHEVHGEGISIYDKILESAQRWMSEGIFGDASNAKEIVNILQRKIDMVKNKLKRSPMRENFGQKELRDVTDFAMRYIHDSSYSSVASILGDMIIDFSTWCENYTGRE